MKRLVFLLAFLLTAVSCATTRQEAKTQLAAQCAAAASGIRSTTTVGCTAGE